MFQGTFSLIAKYSTFLFKEHWFYRPNFPDSFSFLAFCPLIYFQLVAKLELVSGHNTWKVSVPSMNQKFGSFVNRTTIQVYSKYPFFAKFCLQITRVSSLQHLRIQFSYLFPCSWLHITSLLCIIIIFKSHSHCGTLLKPLCIVKNPHIIIIEILSSRTFILKVARKKTWCELFPEDCHCWIFSSFFRARSFPEFFCKEQWQFFVYITESSSGRHCVRIHW